MADTPESAAPKAPAATSQTQSQKPATGQSTTPETTPGQTATQPKAPSAQEEEPAAPSAQGGDPSSTCVEGTSTFKQCFPDPVFRTYLSRKFPLDGTPSDSSAAANKFDDTVVTAAWADGVNAIDGSGFNGFNIPFNTGVQSIQGIQIFSELEHFTASGPITVGFGTVTDYSPMAHLPNLISVDFQFVGSQVSGNLNHANLSSWNSEGMPSLRSITFANSGFRDASQLPRLSKLTSLSLDRSNFAGSTSGQSSDDDRQAFAGFDTAYPSLRELNVAHCETLHADTDFDVLTRMPNLTTLDASSIGYGLEGNIPPAIGQMTQLRSLSMHDDQISDVSLLAGLTGLQQLNLHWNAINDLTPLSGLTQLTSLDVGEQTVASDSYTANPDVTIPVSELANTSASQPVTFQKNAYYRYTNNLGYPARAAINSSQITINSDSVVITDPHADVTPSDLPQAMLDQLVNGQLRNGRVLIKFSAPITNPSTHTQIGTFDGVLTPEIRVPQVVIDMRNGTLNGDPNPGIRQVLSGKYLGSLGLAERYDENGNPDMFKGWKACVTGAKNENAKSCSFETAKDFDPLNDKIFDDTTVYAHWESDDTRKVIFNPENHESSWIQKVTVGDQAEKPENPNLDSHNFMGWFTKPTGGDKYDFTSKVNDNINLYAHWEVPKPVPLSYTVFFDTQNGQSATKQRVVEGKQASKPTTTPSKDDSTFAGWYDSAIGGKEFDFSTPITVDTVVYAHWDSNGGSISPASATPSPSTQIVNRFVTIQNFNTNNTTNNAAPNGGTVNVFRNGGGNTTNTPQQQQTPQAPQTQGRRKVCKANNVRNVSPSIPEDENSTIGSVRQIADYDPQCAVAAPAMVSAPAHSHLNWMWLLLLLFLLLIPFLAKHDRLPDIGQHKSPEIYHYSD